MAEKEYDWLWLFLIVVLVVALLFWGVREAVNRTFRPSHKPMLDSSATLKNQKRRTEEMKENYDRTMQDQKQRIKDMQDMQRR